MKKYIALVCVASFVSMNAMKREFPQDFKPGLDKGTQAVQAKDSDVPIEFILPHGKGLINIWKAKSEERKLLRRSAEREKSRATQALFKLSEGELPVI